MVFSSVTFLFCFLPLCVALYYLPSFLFKKKLTSQKMRVYKNAVLCFASLLFYAWGEPINIILMLISIVFNYALALDMGKPGNTKKTRKRLMVFALAFNLGLLGFFKYSGFVADSIFSLFGAESGFVKPALPIGISFYTFQILSYVIDVYRRRVIVQKSALDFALYVSMFPQLIAGPIVKYSEIEYFLDKRRERLDGIAEGIFMFIKGLAKKSVLANSAGGVYESLISAGAGNLSFVGAWGAVLFFAFQIYFDFSGYSDMAKGLGGMFGFSFPENFNYPYVSVSITDFWRRWHMTLGKWFRDYVYIPLGGGRCSVIRQLFNLFVVWSLTGLWHGASWNFVLWGIYYFILLALEKFVFKNILKKIPVFLRRLLTFALVLFGWTLFSCENIGDIALFFGAMFGKNGVIDASAAYIIATNFILLLILAICSVELFSFDKKNGETAKTTFFRYSAAMLMFVASIICIVSDKYNPFMYFRF